MRFSMLPVMLAAAVVAAFAHKTTTRQAPPVLVTADVCMACHNGLRTPAGEDISIGVDWRASMMANAARDPYWHAAVRREIMDHPGMAAEIEAECTRCHMPLLNVQETSLGRQPAVFRNLADPLAVDGVTCALCHQITEARLGTPASFSGGFVLDTALSGGHGRAFGPFDVDSGRSSLMQSAAGMRPTRASHMERSEFCATCHTLYRETLDRSGKVIGRIAEQMPYREWLNSRYADVRSCQDCHMANVADSTAISSVLGQPRAGVSRHRFTGGNFFILRMLNRYRDELGVTALSQELDHAVQRTEEFLRTATARVIIEGVTVAGGELEATVVVENLAGHKLPTAYPSRRVWLQVSVHDRTGKRVFESGALRADGSIAGNDNDADATRYEPHYENIDAAGEVQIYEAIMVGTEGNVTTGLTTGARHIKDNRLLPAGFDKARADRDIAVEGSAAGDVDFRGGGDRIRYRTRVVKAAAPFRVTAKLWYQPIAFRWAQNFRPYDAPETRRFVSYFEAMAEYSAVVLAADTVTG